MGRIRMLPSKYTTAAKDRSRTTSSSAASRRSQQNHVGAGGMLSSSSSGVRVAAPPLGITGVLCTSKAICIPNRGTLHYTVYRPRMLQPIKLPTPPPSTATTTTTTTRTAMTSVPQQIPQPNPPLICIAGGPGMPSQYLTSLVHLIPDRAIIIYDHIGVGQSSALDRTTLQHSSILDGMVHDLQVLIQHALLPSGQDNDNDNTNNNNNNSVSFHLLGHSLGGIVAFEYVKQQLKQQQQQQQRQQQQQQHQKQGGALPLCRSIVLANAPSSIAASHESRLNLVTQIHQELQQSGGLTSKNTRSSTAAAAAVAAAAESEEDADEDPDAASLWRAAHRIFQQRHECRVSPLPLALQQSLSGLNSHIYTSAQHDALEQYCATSTDLESGECARLPPALVLRGQYDFVQDGNAQAWIQLFGGAVAQYVTIQHSSHYGMVEAEDLYGDVVLAFLRDHDP